MAAVTASSPANYSSESGRIKNATPAFYFPIPFILFDYILPTQHPGFMMEEAPYVQENRRGETEILCSRRTNRCFWRFIRMLLVLAFIMVIGLVMLAYLAVQLGKERDMLLYLQKEHQKYSTYDGNHPTKRGVLWLLGAAIWTGNQIYSFWTLSTTCKEFSSSASNAAQCTWSATTAATFIGAGYTSAKGAKAVAEKINWLGTQVAWKRDNDPTCLEQDIAQFEGLLGEIFQLPVTFDGN